MTPLTKANCPILIKETFADESAVAGLAALIACMQRDVLADVLKLRQKTH
jgi:hypothetical protein